ncbi:MAG: PH domain-containing protein [Chitinophagaceae bacterium]
MRTPLQQNEKILLTTYTSWVMLVTPMLIVLAALMIGIFLISSFKWTLILQVPAAGWFGWKYLEWKHNIWVVTNFRVIDEFGVININSRESPLDKINNVSYSQNIWGRILGFGKVEIQTAATIGETIYESVDNPKLLKDTITSAQANYKNVQMSMQVKDIMQQMQPQVTQQQPPQYPQPPNYQQPQPSQYPQPPAQPQYQSTVYVAPPQQQPPTTQQQAPLNQQIATELEKLFELRQKGILSEEEYKKAKARLIG